MASHEYHGASTPSRSALLTFQHREHSERADESDASAWANERHMMFFHIIDVPFLTQNCPRRGSSRCARTTEQSAVPVACKSTAVSATDVTASISTPYTTSSHTSHEYDIVMRDYWTRRFQSHRRGYTASPRRRFDSTGL